MTIENNVLAALQRLENNQQEILRLLQSSAPSISTKKRRYEDLRENITSQRVAEIERIFWKMVNAPMTKRKMAYRFPGSLLERMGDPPMQGVVVSVLANQCGGRKLFKIRGKDDPAGESVLACVKRHLPKTALFFVEMRHIRGASDVDTMVALSPGEAVRRCKRDITLPESWRLWSCADRAVAHRSPLTGEMLPIPDDPAAGDVVDQEEPCKVAPENVEEETEADPCPWLNENPKKPAWSPETSVWATDAPEEDVEDEGFSIEL